MFPFGRSKAGAVRSQFWMLNAAGTPGNDATVVNTWGAWSLADTLALLNPCGKHCRAWQGTAHTDCRRRSRWGRVIG